MELDRPHLRTSSSTNNAAPNNNSELFICFASRLSSSSSSMKIAKSILSPGRSACDGPVSLSNSLSRRLRSNGSIKGSQGQASPMFPSVGRKKGCNFENPEPSSPKVTCIGQVRVKTKKKANHQTRSLSRRRSGEVSFRKAEQQQPHEFVSINNEDRFSGRNNRHVQECLPERNQRWVHFPMTICEALRTVGAEFSCLFPCRSPCFSTKERGEKSCSIRDEGDQENPNSCGAVFARWFVSLQDCEGRQARQIELVVGGDEDRRTDAMEKRSIRSSRRHVFEDIEFNQEMIELKAIEREEEEKARVSICVPPKNALLLMRCRSDPMKMAALTNRVWEPLASSKDEQEEEEEADAGEETSKKLIKEKALLQEIFHITKETTEPVVNEESQDFALLGEDVKGFEKVEKDAILVEEMQDNEKSNCNEESQIEEQEWIENGEMLEVKQEIEVNIEEIGEEDERCSLSRHSISSRNQDQLAEKIEIRGEKSESESEPELEASSSSSQEEAVLEEIQENGNKTEDSNVEESVQDPLTRLEDKENANKDEENNGQESGIVKESEKSEENDDEQSFFLEETKKIDKKESTTPPTKVLPDCLLLMMCEPKLSMDMSKETWVCSTDFVRWLPERPPVKKVIDESTKKKNTIELSDSNLSQPSAMQDSKTQKNKKKKQHQQTMQPPRSSCTLPAAAAASMATMIEQKLVNAVGYEPFVLTRCKSEPMRTAAAKLIPEACCWKNRKLEPHRREAFGISVAGLGF